MRKLRLSSKTGRVQAACVVALAVLGAYASSGCGLQSANAFIPSADPGSIKHYDSLDGVEITVASKDFTEQLILGNMLAIIFDVAGADVTNQTGIAGSVSARNAMISGDVDVEYEYTGTGWISYLGHPKPIPDRIEQWKAVRDEDLAKNNLAWLTPAPMNNTYALAIRSEKAKELGVKSLSDVVKLPIDEQTFCLETEFKNRADGFGPMLELYGSSPSKIPESNIHDLDTGIIYTATDEGDCNFGEVFTTDGRIKALGLTVMADNKHFFPLYNVAPVINNDLLQEHPEIEEILDPVSAKLTTETMQNLNAEVDVEGREPSLVARDWLRDQGFVT
jgi:osmoprotectant transport system substrate-binding protein